MHKEDFRDFVAQMLFLFGYIAIAFVLSASIGFLICWLAGWL